MKTSDFFNELKPKHDGLLELYRDQRWDEAIVKADECRRFTETAPFEIAGFYDLYEERCNEYKNAPPVAPGEEWDGVFYCNNQVANTESDTNTPFFVPVLN